MNENELGKTLLRGEDAIDIQALTLRVLRRDRRRVWIIGALCLVAWMMVVMLPWATVMPAMARISRTIGQMNGLTSTDGAGATQQQQNLLLVFRVLHDATIATFLFSVGSMFVAALCTVILVVVSRRAALRQVNARLAEISTQLKALAASPR